MATREPSRRRRIKWVNLKILDKEKFSFSHYKLCLKKIFHNMATEGTQNSNIISWFQRKYLTGTLRNEDVIRFSVKNKWRRTFAFVFEDPKAMTYYAILGKNGSGLVFLWHFGCFWKKTGAQTVEITKLHFSCGYYISMSIFCQSRMNYSFKIGS